MTRFRQRHTVCLHPRRCPCQDFCTARERQRQCGHQRLHALRGNVCVQPCRRRADCRHQKNDTNRIKTTVMKKTLSFIVIVLCFTCSAKMNAQDTTVYKSFFGVDSTTMTFFTFYPPFNSGPSYLTSDKDTLIDGYKWKKMIGYQSTDDYFIIQLYQSHFFPADTLLLREDLNNRKLLLLYNDSTEITLQDMSLSVGDTFIRKGTYYDPEGTDMIVIDVFFDSIGKHIVLSDSRDPRNTIKMIEGVGCSDLWYYCLRKWNFQPQNPKIVCKYIDTTLIYYDGTCEEGECLCDPIPVDVQESNDNYVFRPFPNPVEDIISLSSTDGQYPYTEVINLEGKTLLSSYSNQIDVSRLASGTYFLKVWSGKERKIYKFVKK